MVVHPSMSPREVDEAVRRHRFVGFKPYRWYSVTGDIDECRITDFMPENQLEVANRYGLIIRMHLAKKAAIADRENLDDLERLTAKYPRVRWLLAHCARSYSAWPLERAAARLKNIPNLGYVSSSVCETDAFDALFSVADRKRICYGTDDFPVGVTRGKYVSYGSSWGEMNEKNQTLNKAHCDGRLTFVRYEMLRAMRRAARHASLSRVEIEDLFYNNAASLVEAARRDVNAA
jgi:glutamate-1-semialdehyde 2,1-aminomutase